MTETEIRRAQILDLLYDYRSKQPNYLPRFVDLVGEEPEGHEQVVWRGLLRELRDLGLIRLVESMAFSATAVAITDRGRADVEARRDRRNDRAQRNVSARNALIRWLYAQPTLPVPDLRPMLTDPSTYFEGAPLTLDDLDRAAIYLRDKGLLKDWLELTDKGIDCAEHFGGSVADYIRRAEGGNGTTNNINIGEMSGNLAWANEVVTQTATTTTSGLAGDELATLVKALKEASAVFDLGDDDRADLTRNLDVVQGELARDEPNADLVKGLMRRVLETVGKATGSTLSLVMTAYAKHLMQQAGISVG